MAEIKNTFLKGKMNQDLDSRLLPNGEYREAINLQVSRSEGSTVGEFENMLGNTSIKSLNQNDAVVIGQYVNETTNKVYLFATDYNDVDGIRATSANCFIYELNLTTNIKTLLVEGVFLNFNQSFPVIGINLVEDLLFFTDNLNQPRKINISSANPGNIATPTHYTNEDQISVAKYAPCEPILVLDRVNTTLSAIASDVSVITVVTPTIGTIKVGDIFSPLNTITPSSITQFDEVIYVINVASNSITLSRPVTLENGFKVVFQRPTMTNKTDPLLSNGITTEVTVMAGPIYSISAPATDFYSDIIITKGMIVSPLAGIIPDNTTIASAIASFGPAGFIKWTLTFSTSVSNLTNNTVISIGANQNFESAWAGDAAFLEDKFVRFSYRFKFEDNEYSLMAPFSQPMFIPKQFSEFGGGQNGQVLDMDNAYKSTILSWFENDTDNIILKSPMPYSTPQLMSTNLLVTEIDLLYKESDALAVKVLDTIKISDLTSTSFESIIWKDVLSGQNTEYYYPYDYASSKPYKTLPSNQTTRVYDKVPIKALAQELIGNRVVYGNYVDKHSSPASINFSALIDKKKSYDRNFVQYPYHNVKQNRTYQVGFVLSDRYGRQSDVILSSYDSLDGTAGSTIFSPYNSYNDQLSNPIIDWLGDTLKVTVDNAIGTGTGAGEPGVWNATTNPLGWYSYKVVVKQQQQEYYNVYLPGFVNGLPIIGSDEENKASFSVLLSDNINKVPRNLNEVGPTDTEYSSSELLYFRVNNPNIDNQTSRPYGYPQKSIPWNKQYFPGFIDQEVLSISTVRDMEIAAIPFVASAPEGDYGQIGTSNTNPVAGNPSVATPISIGSLPWGQSPITQPFYNSDLNPFALKIDTTPNGVAVVSSEVPIVPGGIGAVTTANAAGGNNINTMVPFLSVAETKPVFSLLEIFWETSLQGKISVLNNLIDSQFAGIGSLTISSSTFLESDAAESKIGNSIQFVTGGGNTVVNSALLAITIESVYRASDINQSTNLASLNLFTIADDGTNAGLYDLKIGAASAGVIPFWYSAASNAVPSSDVYTINIKAVYTASGQAAVSSVLPYVATLENEPPTFVSTANPTGITIASTVIKTYTAKNGSANSTDEAKELIFDLDPSQPNFSSISSQFTVTQAGVLSTNSALTEGQQYSVKVRVTDVNGAGLSAITTATFTVGVQPVPKSICEGRQGAVVAGCGESYATYFLANSTTPTFSFPFTVNGQSFPTPTYNYNVRNNPPSGETYTTGKLTQGVMKITPTLIATGAPSGGSVSLYYTIQRRTGTNSWAQAVDTGNNVIGAIQLQASNGVPGTDNKLFSIVGEYRVVTTDIGGEGCPATTGTIQYYTEFSDATYPSGTCTGP